MRRVTAFFAWQVANWRQIAHDMASTAPSSHKAVEILAAADIDAQNRIRQGKIAYAYQQASTHETMKLHCEKKWQDSDLVSRLLHMEDGDARVVVEYIV
jgi:hypothetical protein